MENESIKNVDPLRDDTYGISQLAVLSLIISFIFFVPFISGLAAIILGIIALYQIAQPKNKLYGLGFAVTGIVVGFLQFVGVIVFLFCILYTSTIRMPSPVRQDNSFNQSSPQKDYGQTVGVKEFASYNEQGIYYGERGKYQEALQAYEKALATARKEVGMALYGIGTSHMNVKNYQEAIKLFDQAIEYNPNLYDAYQNKAVTYRLMGRYEDSVKACKETVRLFPDFSSAWCSMGWAYEYLGDYRQAVNAYLESIRLAPRWQFARSRIELCLEKIDDNNFVEATRAELEKIDSESKKK